MRKIAVLASALGAFAVGSSAFAESVQISFVRIDPHNSSENPASQFNCVMSEVTSGPGAVSFAFTNAATGAIASSISEIYFDTLMLNGAATLIQDENEADGLFTHFTSGGSNPGDLPGGNNVGFEATSLFSADAQGNPRNGIDNTGEVLDMRFDLAGGVSFADLVAALQSGELRLGLHVRAIGRDGQSDSFVNGPEFVPLPSAALSGGAVLAGCGFLGGRRRRALHG